MSNNSEGPSPCTTVHRVYGRYLKGARPWQADPPLGSMTSQCVHSVTVCPCTGDQALGTAPLHRAVFTRLATCPDPPMGGMPGYCPPTCYPGLHNISTLGHGHVHTYPQGCVGGSPQNTRTQGRPSILHRSAIQYRPLFLTVFSFHPTQQPLRTAPGCPGPALCWHFASRALALDGVSLSRVATTSPGTTLYSPRRPAHGRPHWRLAAHAFSFVHPQSTPFNPHSAS